MFLIGLVLIACALLAWLLVALRRYEHESAAAALKTVNDLQDELGALRLRVESLEAIAAAEESIIQPDTLVESVSSPEHPRIRS